MSAGQAKEDNLIQLKSNENNTDNIRLNNKINNLEKTVNDIDTELKISSSDLRSKLNDIGNVEADIEQSVNKTLEKITSVESEISQLYRDIDNTNVAISENVKKIESEQTDLSTKVSETYKQLGSVEKSYSTLKTKSNKITKDIKDITLQVETVSDEIRQQIISIENNTSNLDSKIDVVETQSVQLAKQVTAGQEELIERTNSIVSEAKKTAMALEKSIKENAALMAKIEAKLVTEIESLAQSTDEKTSNLSNDIDKANSEIKSHSAKMLKLQSVDEALDKRAVTLEETAKSLTAETQLLLKSVETLDTRSTALEDTVETLGIKVYRIEQENEIQQVQLGLLKEKTTQTNATLVALSRLVSFNFVSTGIFLTILVASMIALYIYQDNLWSLESSSTAQRTEQVNQQINGLTQHVNTTDDKAADRIAQLENQVITLNQQLKTVNDKNVSLDNRLVNIAPHRKIGNDNILHSQQWIKQQSDDHFSIKVLTAKTEKDMFELAVRYNHYLNDVLSYKTILDKDAVEYILYMGSYADQTTAETAIKSLPFRLNGEEPSLTTFAKMK